MKIRTRLLLFLLPTLLGGIALISMLLQKFEENPFLILASATLTLFIVISILFTLANRISEPVQKLNNAALAIAAGQYGESISVEGPKEIVDLANTLNTMSECLLENINRLKENSFLRERMYGEYESAMLLQHLMLQKNIDDCRSDAVAIKSITFFSDSPRGLLLDFPRVERADLFHIHVAEAKEEGFEAMYELVAQYKYSKEKQDHILLKLDRATSQLEWKEGKDHERLYPLLWSSLENRLIPLNGAPLEVQSGDFLFIYNQGLEKLYKTPQKVADLLSKVLRVFAVDGLETVVSMLQKEIAFATKRKDLEADLHLLCFQILRSTT